mgnify:CR=1 FL=1
MSEFFIKEPSLENYWRAIILFGRNVASYKFALAKALLEMKGLPNDLIKLDQLAEPFSRHLCEHLKHSPKQITSSSSTFITTCQQFNLGEISRDELIGQTVKMGFNNVIDAFHVVNREDVPKRFFLDERKSSGGIRLTDNFNNLTEVFQFNSFQQEAEARWRLVEEAWALGISAKLISVDYNSDNGLIFINNNQKRTDLTSCRDSLNGYQKGRCFYCYDEISIVSGDDSLADIDHFIPWVLRNYIPNIDSVWNLVLSCKECNGAREKSAKLPHRSLLERLYRRNEYLINSHLPLRNALMRQTGKIVDQRITFLNETYQTAKNMLIHEWKPTVKGIITF